MRRSRSRPAGDLDVVDVLIVEDDDGDVAADEVRAVLRELALEAMAWRATWPGEPERTAVSEAPVEDPARPGLARRLARRYRRRMVTGAVLAVVVALTVAVMDVRRTAARAASLAATPAVLAEASRAPSELWRVRGRVTSDLDDRLLVADGASLHAVHPATGAVLWTASEAAGRAASAGDCDPVDEALLPGRAPVDDGDGPRGLVACVADATAATSPGDATADVVVVDSTTGRTRHSVTVDGALLLAEPVGRDLLLTAALADRTVRVTRWDLATGAPRWDTVSPVPVLLDGPVAVERRPDSLTVGAFAVDLATGEGLDPEDPYRDPHPYEEHALPGGARAVWGWHEDGTSGRGYVSGGDAGRSFMLPGPPLRPSVTDGSDGGVLVVHTAPGDRLRGMDLRSGRMEWTQPHAGASPLRATALVDGVMLLEDDHTVTALDLGTGRGIWRTPVDPDMTDGAPLTDGTVVVLPVRAEDGVVHLVARRIADGEEVWRVRAPSGTVSITVVDRHLVASTDTEVIGLG